MILPDFVITKTPLRVSFLGGGTDFEYFYKKYGGSVISAAINRYVYVTVKRHKDHFNEKFRLNYSVSETVQNAKGIKNNIIRECIKITKINFPIYISIFFAWQPLVQTNSTHSLSEIASSHTA